MERVQCAFHINSINHWQAEDQAACDVANDLIRIPQNDPSPDKGHGRSNKYECAAITILNIFSSGSTITMFLNLTLAVLSLAAFTCASTLQINNYCSDSIYLAFSSPSKPYPEPFKIKPGQAYAAGENLGEGSA